MTTLNFSNFAQTTLSSQVQPGDTTINVISATGFPAVPFLVVIDSEVMLVTNKGGLAWTVTRAQETGQNASVAAYHAPAAVVSHDLTAGTMSQLGGGLQDVVDDTSPQLGGDLDVNSHSLTGYTADRLMKSDNTGKLVVSGITSTTASYLDATSSIQTQLNSKQATITGGATTIASSNLTASRAVVSDSGGKVAASSVTATELGYVAGVSSAVQTQLNSKANTADLATVATTGAYGDLSGTPSAPTLGSVLATGNDGGGVDAVNLGAVSATAGTFSGQVVTPLVTASTAIDFDAGNVQQLTLVNGDNTLTFANPVSGSTYLLQLVQPSSGAAGTVTWPTMLWQGGVAPTLSITNGQTDLICMLYAGSTYYGSSSLGYA